MHSNDGTVTGTAQRLTQTPHLKGLPSVSPDGLIATFYTPGEGGNEIWTVNTATGVHERLVPRSYVTPPVMRLDGARVAYGRFTSDPPSSPPLIETVPVGGGPAERLCRCGWVGLSDWSADSRWLLLLDDADNRPLFFSVLDLRTGTAVPMLRHPRHGLYEGHFSSNGRWVAFMEVVEGFKRSRLWAAPVRNAMVPPQEWVALTEGETWDDKPRWSPDGGIFYFVSWRDGFPCIWGRRVDRENKTPIGEPFDVYHSHDARLAIRNIPPNYQAISVGRDRIILNMGEMTGNIWSLPLRSGAK